MLIKELIYQLLSPTTDSGGKFTNYFLNTILSTAHLPIKFRGYSDMTIITRLSYL